jgi:small-conductance mechanosensitive channel
LVGKVARYAIWVFAILIALDQLQVAQGFVSTLFTGVVIAASLAIGLAFGLGGQATAAHYLEHLRSEIKE